MPGRDTTDPEDTDRLVGELVDRWAPVLKQKTWDERLTALNEIHDHLMEEIQDFQEFSEVFPKFIAELVERLNGHPIHNLPQAHILANSANPEHRRRAGDWMRRHGHPDPSGNTG